MSSAPRVYITPERIGAGRIRFSEEELHHVKTVLRLRRGDEVRATDGKGTEYLLRLTGAGREPVGEIVGESRPRRESPLKITLLQALPKGDRMAHVIQKAVELGVASICPVTTARTVVTPGRGRVAGRRRRWQRIVEAAVAQSGRVHLPVLRDVTTWDECLRDLPEAEVKIILLEGEPCGLKEVLERHPGPASLLLAVGPEGGWEAEEIEAARRTGFDPAGLGPRVLRTETAGPVALGVVQYVFGDLGGHLADSEKCAETI